MIKKIGLKSFVEKVIFTFVKEIRRLSNNGPNNHGRGNLINNAINPPKAPIKRAA